jgi:hypothetical protein
MFWHCCWPNVSPRIHSYLIPYTFIAVYDCFDPTQTWSALENRIIIIFPVICALSWFRVRARPYDPWDLSSNKSRDFPHPYVDVLYSAFYMHTIYNCPITIRKNLPFVWIQPSTVASGTAVTSVYMLHWVCLYLKIWFLRNMHAAISNTQQSLNTQQIWIISVNSVYRHAFWCTSIRLSLWLNCLVSNNKFALALRFGLLSMFLWIPKRNILCELRSFIFCPIMNTGSFYVYHRDRWLDLFTRWFVLRLSFYE